MTPLIVQSPNLLEGDNILPLTRAVAKMGKRTSSLVWTALLPEIKKVSDPSPQMPSSSNSDGKQDLPKMTKSERLG